jgi:hypothetical protein
LCLVWPLRTGVETLLTRTTRTCGLRNVHAASQRIFKIEVGEGTETEGLRNLPAARGGFVCLTLKR